MENIKQSNGVSCIEEKMYSKEEVKSIVKEVYPEDKQGMSLYVLGKVYKNLDVCLNEILK